MNTRNLEKSFFSFSEVVFQMFLLLFDGNNLNLKFKKVWHVKSFYKKNLGKQHVKQVYVYKRIFQ